MAQPNSLASFPLVAGTSASFTVPSDATYWIIGVTWWGGTSSTLNAPTVSSFGTVDSTTNNAGTAGPPYNQFAAYAQGPVTSTGASKTVTLSWTGGTRDEGPTGFIHFFKDQNATTPVFDVNVARSTEANVPATASVDTTADTSCVALDSGYLQNALSTPSGWTLSASQDNNINRAGIYTRAASLSDPQTFTGISQYYRAVILWSLQGVTGGGTSHAATGALVGPGSTVAGSAAHSAAHASSGALVGPGSAVVGSAARTRAHAATGALTGPGSTVAGAAQHNVPHASSGALTGPGSTVTGTSARTRAHPASGDLVGPGSTVSGTAARTRAHASSGALTGPGSVVDGAAARTRQHAASGDLTGPGSVIVGDADHQGAAGTHDATGALVGPGSTVAGAAARFRAFAASGTLTGQGSVISGSAARVAGSVSHAATGVLVGPGSVVNGSAARADPPVSHNATGVLVGPGSLLNGQAQVGDSIIDTHDGFWVREWRKMVEREKKLTVEEVMEIVEEAPREVLEAIPEVKKQVKKEYGRVDYQRIANNLQMQRFIAEQILVRHEMRMQELEEDDLEVLLLL